jgi:hypothetical protein
LITSLDDQIREELPAILLESLPQIAPIFSEIESTTMRVTRNTDIGRGWKVTHLFDTGVSGEFQNASPNGPAVAGTTNMRGTETAGVDPDDSDLTPFPDGMASQYPGVIKRQLTLHRVTGNFNIPNMYRQADMLNATQIEEVARILKGVGKGKAILEAASFFAYKATNSSGYKTDVLGRVSAAAEISTTNHVLITINEAYGRIHNFRTGMLLDIHVTSTDTLQEGASDDGSDIVNVDDTTTGVYINVVVTNVDYVNRTITVRGHLSTTGAIVAYDDTHGWTGEDSLPIAAGMWLVAKKCGLYASATRPMISWGLEDWIAASGTILGGNLNIDTYRQFRSLVKDVSGPLTEMVLNKYLRGFLDSYPGVSIDTFISSAGVIDKFQQQAYLGNNKFNYDRTGKALAYKGGWSMISYSYDGRDIRWIVSPMCLKNTLYGIKLGEGNIKRYVPPRLGGTDGGVDSNLEFYAPTAGFNGIFMPVQKANTTTGIVSQADMVQAPFWMYTLTCPMDVRSIKLYNLTEDALV